MKILVSLPVYNESAILTQSVRTVHSWCTRHLNRFDWELVIADNGSTDDTVLKATALSHELPHISVFHTDEKGRGQVLGRLWRSREADIYTYMDVDLAVDLKAFLPLIESLANNEADVAIGSRFLKNASVKRSMLREFTSRMYNFLVHLILKLRVADTQCGFKGINKKAAQTILLKATDPGWFWDTELLTFAQYDGLKTKEIPVEWVETRTAGRKSKVALIHTILNYLANLWRLKKKLSLDPRVSQSSPEDDINKRKALYGNLFFATLIFITSFVASAALANHQSIDRYYDQGNYLLAARLMSQGLVPHQDFAMGHFATYPWLLSLLIRLGGSFEFLRLFHFTVIAASLVALFFLLRTFARIPVVLITLGFLCLSPLWLMHSSLILLDHPALLFITLSILVAIKYQSTRGSIVSGLLLGLALITKVIVFIPVFAFGFTILLSHRNLLTKKLFWLFVASATIPFAFYLLLLNPYHVWSDIFVFHLNLQRVMNFDERLLAFFGIFFLGSPFIFLSLLGGAVAWRDPRPIIKLAAYIIPPYLFLLIIQRSVYYHHITLLLPALLLVFVVTAASLPRDVLRRLSIACFFVAALIFGTFRGEWYQTQNTNQHELVSFLKTIHEPVFTWTPFWVLGAGGTIEPWYYMATSDMAAKRGTTSEQWQIFFKKSPYIVVDKRTRSELLPSALTFIEQTFEKVFVNSDFTVYKNPRK